MSERQTSLGRIEVSPAAIASIARQATLSCYGVVGTSSRDLATGLVNALAPESRRGVEVRIVKSDAQEEQIMIDVYVIIEYGTRVAAVAQSVMNVVKFQVERVLGMPVAEVNVHVQGLRVSNTD